MPGETILVVDDSPTTCKLVELSLTKAGYRVDSVDTGEGGIAAATAHPPDLILLDFLLPDINGDDVCRAISGNVSLAGIPVVVMSAKGEEIGENFAIIPNVMNIIAKPFSPDALVAVIGHTLEKSGRRNQPPVPPAEAEKRVDLAALLAPEDPPKGKKEGGGANPRDDRDSEIVSFDGALCGDLAVFSVADVLLLLQDRNQTGTVSLSRGKARLQIYLGLGRVEFAGARGIAEEFLLGHFLVSGGYLSEPDLERVIDERQTSNNKELLGAYLVGRGLLAPAGLRKAMAKQTAALVYESLRWGNGQFVFRPSADLPTLARDAALGLAVDGLILEGLRRVEEWRIIEREIGDFDMTFVRNEDKLASFSRGQLLREEVAIAELVNGRNSVRDLIQISKMGSYDVTQILFRLLRSKLIRRRVAPVAV